MELGKTLTLDFIVSDPATGEPINADSTPTADVYEDLGVAPMYSPAPALRGPSVGHYLVTLVLTAANGFEKGKSYNAVLTATVGGITAKIVLISFLIDDVMDKKTNVAAIINIPAPPTFIPVVDPLDLPVPVTLDGMFGQESDNENQDYFMQYWDVAGNKWVDGAATAVPADFMLEVTTQRDSIIAYNEALAEWQANYDIQKEVQWRATFADALIAGTE